MNAMKELSCHCALNKVFGFKPKIALTLVEHLGSASAVFDLDKDSLSHILGNNNDYLSKFNKINLDQEGEEIEHLFRDGFKIIHFNAPNYPPLLKECADPPLVLYIRSNSEIKDIFARSEFISIVGTRDISPYGAYWAENIVASIAQTYQNAGLEVPTIVSGLAYGTDIIAHKTALQYGAPTIGIMATGIDSTYPAKHEPYAKLIENAPASALITDYPPGTSPKAFNFIRRNRIIAGLSKNTILIESKIKGGGMITCRAAFSYDRNVFALPGRIDDERSKGCNLLISQKIAEPISDIPHFLKTICNVSPNLFDDLVLNTNKNELEIKLRTLYGEKEEHNETQIQINARVQLMKKIATIIQNNRGITISKIATCLGLRYDVTAGYVNRLSYDGLIKIDMLSRCSSKFT